MSDDNVIKGPFDEMKIVNEAMENARAEVSMKAAKSIDGIIAEGILRVTGKDWELIDIKKRCHALRAANATHATYYLDGEAFLILHDPVFTNEIATDGQWSVVIDVYHKYLGAARR